MRKEREEEEEESFVLLSQSLSITNFSQRQVLESPQSELRKIYRNIKLVVGTSGNNKNKELRHQHTLTQHVLWESHHSLQSCELWLFPSYSWEFCFYPSSI